LEGEWAEKRKVPNNLAWVGSELGYGGDDSRLLNRKNKRARETFVKSPFSYNKTKKAKGDPILYGGGPTPLFSAGGRTPTPEWASRTIPLAKTASAEKVLLHSSATMKT